MMPTAPRSQSTVLGLQFGAIPALGQHSFSKVESLLKLCHLRRLAGQAVLDLFQRCGLVLQLLTELGQLGSRGSPAAYGARYGARNQHQRGTGDRECSEENGLAHVSCLPGAPGSLRVTGQGGLAPTYHAVLAAVRALTAGTE